MGATLPGSACSAEGSLELESVPHTDHAIRRIGIGNTNFGTYGRKRSVSEQNIQSSLHTVYIVKVYIKFFCLCTAVFVHVSDSCPARLEKALLPSPLPTPPSFPPHPHLYHHKEDSADIGKRTIVKRQEQ